MRDTEVNVSKGLNERKRGVRAEELDENERGVRD